MIDKILLDNANAVQYITGAGLKSARTAKYIGLWVRLVRLNRLKI